MEREGGLPVPTAGATLPQRVAEELNFLEERLEGFGGDGTRMVSSGF